MHKVKKISFYLIRHGETDWNFEKRLQGKIDIPLNKRGISQANNLRKTLQNISYQEIYSSPLGRSLQTAQIATQESKRKIQTSLDLIEIDVGLAEGLTPTDIEAKWGSSALNAWRGLTGSIENAIFPEGESFNQVVSRMNNFFSQLIQIPQLLTYTDVLVFSHGGIIRRFLADLTKNKNFPPISNCECHQIEIILTDSKAHLLHEINYIGKL